MGWGGVPTGAGLVDGEVDQGPWLQERVGAKKGEGWGLVGCSREEQVQGRLQGRVGLAVGGGARASVASFLTRTKRRKMAFFEGCPVGWGGVPTGAGLVEGRPRALIPGAVHGRSGRRGKAWGGCKGGANFATCVVFLLFLTRTKRRKMAFFEPGGGGGRPRALIPGKGSGGGRGVQGGTLLAWWRGG